MTGYVAPLRDMDFVLEEIVGIDRIKSVERFKDLDSDLFRAVLEEAAKLIENTVSPTNREGDEVGCVFRDGRVMTPPGFKEAYAAYVQGGWVGLALDTEYGGQGLPHLLGVAVSEMLCGANTAFSLYPALSRAVFRALYKHGSKELKDLILPRLGSGQWCGTMCMSEPQAGSDVGAIRTKAMRQEDGSYRLEGSKVWISGGEHDLTEQIIHLVLARVPGAPEGTRGLSLFVVPKRLVNSDGSLGAPNAIGCGGIERKMGINGSATCSMNLDGAAGHLIGEENCGIQNMFTVMNYGRLEIALQGLGIAERATQNAIRYARERRQGPPLVASAGQKGGQQPIISHPDVRRMLFTMKAYTEGMRMLGYWVGHNIDVAEHHANPEARTAAQDVVDLMIPVCKALFTDLGVEIANLGVQVFGGVGYMRDYGMEQNVRDARTGPIYEGTNGIQALDLVRRKLRLHDGRLQQAFFAGIKALIAEQEGNSDLTFIVCPLKAAAEKLEAATDWMVRRGEESPEDVAAGACEYSRAFGLVASGHMWAKAARLALAKPDDPFCKGKLATARFYAERLLLPPVEASLRAAMAGGESFVALDEALL